MFLRVLSPTGQLRIVKNVLPLKEARITFNSQKRRIVEVCADGEEPNGIAFLCKEISPMAHPCDRELTVMNLKPEVVREIMRKLLSDGYYDLSQLEYQAKVETVEETKLDKAGGVPYTSEKVICWCETGVFNPVFSPDPFSRTCLSMEAIGENDDDGWSSIDEDSESDDDEAE